MTPEEPRVFTDKATLMSLLKRVKTARFKAFHSEDQAVAFSSQEQVWNWLIRLFIECLANLRLPVYGFKYLPSTIYRLKLLRKMCLTRRDHLRGPHINHSHLKKRCTDHSSKLSS